MSDGLPQQIDVRRFADSGRHLQGELALVQFQRLSKLVEPSQKSCSFPLRLDFFRQDDGQRVIKGHIEGSVSMICQRCLEPVEVNLSSDISLGVVASDAEAELLPEELDPLVLDESIELYELLEDELLLAMPIVPVHKHCDIPGNIGSKLPENKELPERENPFAILASLKRDS